MAKVTAPLLSMSASGKIGKAMVFATNKGRNVVRGLVTPSNPKSTGQGTTRLFMGAVARSAKAVITGSGYYNDLKTVVPSGQSWNSTLTTDILTTYGNDDAGIVAMQAEVAALTATNLETEAASKGLSDITISYAGGVTTITAGEMLYMLAKHAFNVKANNPSLFDRAPYDTALASWDDTDVTAFVADL